MIFFLTVLTDDKKVKCAKEINDHLEVCLIIRTYIKIKF